MCTRSIFSIALPVFVVTLAAPLRPSDAAQEKTPPASAPTATWKGDPYTLATDAVSGEALGPIEKQTKIDHEGRELRFATKENAEKFKADPKKYLAAVDAKMIADQKTVYPLDTCLVTGDKLGAGAVDIVYKNRLVRLSSKEHEAKFLEDPVKSIQKLDSAVAAKQGPTYAAKKCAVTDEDLGSMGKPFDYVVGNRLIRLCCKGCKSDVMKDPMKYLTFPDRKNATEAGEKAKDSKG
ncbi:MAG: hypothetical protein ACKVXR_11395 [Planctomycetota bacterium]